MSVVRRRSSQRVAARRGTRSVSALWSRRRDPETVELDATTLTTPPDTALATATVLLMAIGMVFVYSAGPSRGGDSLTDSLLLRQFLAGLMGCAFMYGLSRISLAALDRFTLAVVALAVVTQILVFVPGIGATVKGATRWIRLGPFSFQPSELARIACVLYAARFAARHPEWVVDWRNFWRGFLVPGVFFALVYAQKDLDTALFMLIYAGIVYFIAGMPWRLVIPGNVAAAALAAYYIQSEPYRLKRYTAFLNPEDDPTGANYQVNQGLHAMGSGGLFGRGLGGSVQKYGFLPEAHTDFIFAVIGEEGGLLVTFTIVVLFGVLAWRGYRIAMGQSIPYARYLAAGITATITVQGVINMLVVTSCIPVAGIPLPLVSYGGTSILFVAAALGILWGLSRRRES